MTYASGSVDGLTKSTNNQAPWVGEGWSLSGVNFVERTYRSCRDDGVSYTGGDLCWVGVAPVSIVLNGKATRLIDNSGNGWKAEDDSLGWKVERLTGATANGARDGEYFKVTTMDGTQYFFGYRDRASYGGVQRVEVFGNNSGEPCYVGTNFNANHCPQAYRWNLDYVQDRNGNTMVYNWQLYDGNYGMNRNTTAVTYDITSTLLSIEYGANVNVSGSTPTGKVTFNQGFRCFYGDCAHTTDPSVWMDTPWDQRCETTASSCPGLYAPTFWTLYKMDEARSHVWDVGIGGWSTVDYIAPSYGFPSTGDYISPSGDDTSPSLWAWKIWLHNRPPIDIGGARFANRVFWGNDLNRAPMNHYRINWLKSGTGQTTNVYYSQEECTRTNVYDGASDRNPRRCFPQWEVDQFRWYHKYVVWDVTVEDNVGGSPTERWHYDYSTTAAGTTMSDPAYAHALWHYDENWLTPASRRAFSQWRGYSNVKTTHGNADGTGPQQVGEDIFYRGMNGDRTNAGGFGARIVTFSDGWDHTIVDHEAMRGQLRRSMTFDGRSGVWTSAVRHIPTITTTGGMYMGGGTPDIYAYRALETTTITQTVMAGPTYRLTQVDTTYDAAYPVPTFIKDHGDTNDPTDDRCNQTAYAAPDLTRYLVNFPKETFTTTCAQPLTKTDYLAGTRFYYDHNDTTPGVLGAGASAKARVTRTTALEAATAIPLATSDWANQTKTVYDTYGRVKESYDGLDRKTTTVYTPATGGPTLSVAVTSPPPSGSGVGFTTTTTLDPRWGQPVTIIDPNGKVTRAEYDASGRVVRIWKNNRAPTSTTGVVPDIEYGYVLRDNGPNYVTTQRLGPTGVLLPLSYTVFDGRLRPRRTEDPAASGSGRIVTDNVYDTVGSLAKSSRLNNSSEPNGQLDLIDQANLPIQQRFTYDNLGRKTLVQQWATSGGLSGLQWEVRYAYDGDKVVRVTPPGGGTATSTIANARGKVVELRQHRDGNPASSNYLATQYTYDRLSQLTKVVDGAGVQWTYEYDLLGRRTKTTDPDAGVSTKSFDDANQLTNLVDGNNNTLVYKYDLLGRKTELRENTPTGSLRASWTYDTVAKGKLSTTSRIDSSGTYALAVGSYGDDYQVKSSTYTIPGFGAGGGALSYTVESEYNANGSPKETKLPDVGDLSSETLAYSYTALGLPYGMQSGQGTYVGKTEYHYDGLVYRRTLGTSGKQVRVVNDRKAATRRLISDSVELESQSTPGTFQTAKFSNSYSYDQSGHITAIAGKKDGVDDQKECFQYDYLAQLKEAWTQTSGTCATPQRTGEDPYQRQWQIDDFGNRQTQVDVDPSAGNTTWTYTTGAAGSVKPHQLSKVTATGPKSGTALRTFGYDAAGNTTARTSETGAAQTLTWDMEGHLATVAEGSKSTSYVYDTAGNRLITKTVSGGTTTTTLYLPDGTELQKDGTANPLGTRHYGGIAMRDASGLRWTIGDHHGTGVAQIKADTLQVNRRRSLPFGEDRGTSAGWVGAKGFVGGTKDDTGLTHLGMREYDRSVGRFISADPIVDTSDPQQMHGYSYANNTPPTLTDPDGLSPFAGEEAGLGRPAAGSASAHATAIALRVARLKAMFPHATITSDPSDQGGPDIVCWDCTPEVVWVWEVKSEYGGEAGGTREAYKTLDNTQLDAARNDPLAKGRPAVYGPMFEKEDKGRNPILPSQEVTVRSRGPGVELYRVTEHDDERATVHLKKKTDEAFVLAQVLNKEADGKRQELIRTGQVVPPYVPPGTSPPMDRGNVTSGPEDVIVYTGAIFFILWGSAAAVGAMIGGEGAGMGAGAGAGAAAGCVRGDFALCS